MSDNEPRGHGVKGRSGPPGNRNAAGGKANLKHGYYSLVRLVKNRRGALDKRTILGKMVLETVRELETDLGGDLSTAERMLVADVALDTLLLQALNNSVADASPIIKTKNKGMHAHPVYQLRAQLIAQRREHLKLLGIKRVSKTLTWQELLAQDDPPSEMLPRATRMSTEASGQRASGFPGAQCCGCPADPPAKANGTEAPQ